MKFEKRSDKIRFYVCFILLLLDTLAWIPGFIFHIGWEIDSASIRHFGYKLYDIPFLRFLIEAKSFILFIINIPIAIILSIANINQLKIVYKSDNKKQTKIFIFIVVIFLIITDLVLGRIVENLSFVPV